jgi:O-antigen ligase
VLAGYCVIRTYSRGGALAFFTIIVLTLVAARRAIPLWVRLAIVPAVVLGLTFAPGKYIDRLKTLSSLNQDYNLTAKTGRKQIWARGLGYFAQRPLTGVGVGQFGKAEGQWGRENSINNLKWSAAHNMWIETAAELGLVGIVSLSVMILSTIGLWRRIRLRDPANEDELRFQRAAEAMGIAFTAFVVGTMFLSATLNPLTLFLPAIAVSLHTLPQVRSLTNAPARTSMQHVRARPVATSGAPRFR